MNFEKVFYDLVLNYVLENDTSKIIEFKSQIYALSFMDEAFNSLSIDCNKEKLETLRITIKNIIIDVLTKLNNQITL